MPLSPLRGVVALNSSLHQALYISYSVCLQTTYHIRYPYDWHAGGATVVVLHHGDSDAEAKPSPPAHRTGQKFHFGQKRAYACVAQLDTIGPQLLNGPYPRPRQWPGSALWLTYDHSERHTGSHGVMVAVTPWRHCQMSANESLLTSGSATMFTYPSRRYTTRLPLWRTVGGAWRPNAPYGCDTYHAFCFFLGEKCGGLSLRTKPLLIAPWRRGCRESGIAVHVTLVRNTLVCLSVTEAAVGRCWSCISICRSIQHRVCRKALVDDHVVTTACSLTL